MNPAWPMVLLEEVLMTVSRGEKVDPNKKYDLLGAHWYAMGLYIKETKSGSQIRVSKLYRVKEGDFVYNRLFAWVIRNRNVWQPWLLCIERIPMFYCEYKTT